MEKPTKQIAQFEWGLPTEVQRNGLLDYIGEKKPMSIYDDSGIYEQLEAHITAAYATKYCLLTNTGTSALASAYFGLGITEGDEVIVPTYTFLATVTPLLRLNAKIVFCDGNPITGNIEPDAILSLITKRTKAIAITHMWGIPCDVEIIQDIAKAHNLLLIEDCSHAHFTRYNGRLLGTFGDVACFSVGAKKTLTCGEGGFLITNNPEVYLRATLLGHFDKRSKVTIDKLKKDGYSALSERYTSLTTGFGENYRMHPYAAVMLYSLLSSGEAMKIIASRGESLRYFIERLDAIPNIDVSGYDENYFTGAMYGLKPKLNTSGRPLHDVLRTLQAHQINAKIPDTGLLHHLDVFRQFRQFENRFDGAKAYLEGRISIPTFSSGLVADKPVIDIYCEVFDYVLNGR